LWFWIVEGGGLVTPTLVPQSTRDKD
jgi:hypothetical protein